MTHRYLLVLVALNEDMEDIGGTVYPSDGFVISEGFTDDHDIRNGLNGILWGASDNLLHFSSSQRHLWAVLKIEEDDDFIILDPATNIIKFRRGYVVCQGDLSCVSRYIANFWLSHVPGEQDIAPSQIVGFIDKADLPNKHALASGADGHAVSEVGGLHAIATSRNGKSGTSDVESHAVALGDGGQACTIKDSTVAVVAGEDGVVTTCGQNSKAVSINKSSRAFSTGHNSISVCLELDGIAAAGVNGTLIMAYESDGKKKFAVGYVGEDVIPNRMYRCESGKFALVH